MQEKSRKLSRRSIYLILLAVTFIAIAILVSVSIAKSKKGQMEVPKQSTSDSVSNVEYESVTPSTSSIISESDKPTVTEIVFDLPISGGNVITEYTAATVVYNKTLGIYTGHMGIDIAGSENAQVVCAFDGIIKDISSTYLEGTTVIVDHGEGLETIYNSIEPLETLTEGQTVFKGELLGIASTNNKQEYKDGAHLHFEVHENGKNVDPFKYIAVVGK